MRVLDETRMNTHQTHLEDLVLLGKEGIEELNDKVDKFIRRFDSSKKELNLTQKIDGAPALFVWHKFSGYPDNSIALKGFTSGPNTAMSSAEQIDAKYADRPGMAAKLKLGLQLAKYIPAGECWQGDCLFSHNDIKEQEINGTDYLTFMPNKIVYAFSENNADYDKVKNSDFGIAFHTIYKDSNGKMSQGFDVDPTRLNAPDNFYIMSPAINASSNKDDYNIDELEKQFEELKSSEQKLVNNPAYEELINNSVFMSYWNTFENATLADKKQVNINVNTFINDLKDFIKDRQEKEYNKKLSTLKTDKGKAAAEIAFNNNVEKLENIVEDNKSMLTDLVNTLNLAANIKMNMWAGLRKAKNDYSTYYKSRTKGFIPAEGEGIAMSDMDGNIVKIVDRSTFSSYNRDPDIMSGFEHESLELHEDYDLNPTLKKALGNKESEFKQLLKKLILDHSIYNNDIYPLGMYREDRDKGTNQELAHKFWLDKFGLDTSRRGMSSAITGAIMNASHEIEDSDEYKDTLDWDDSNRLPKDEQFKINLFYEWDAIRKDPFGDYSDDDPRKHMSFREFLQDKLDSGDYDDDREEQLIIDTIKDVKGGSGYFKEMMATQGADMGTFKKTVKVLEEASEKTAVIAFGRLNPPSIGHRKLAKIMASLAKGEKPKLYLSHKVNSVSDPLSYDSKIKWAKKELGDLVDVVESDAKNVFEALKELYNQGYTDIIYVGGEDRVGGKDDYSKQLLAYNGKKDKNGNLVYQFNSIIPMNAGKRSIDSQDPEEQASASLLRKLVLEDNFKLFKKYVYLNDSDAYGLFKELKYAMKGKEESFLEAANNRIKLLLEKTKDLTKNKYTPEMKQKLDKELKLIDKNLEAPDENAGLDYFRNNKDDYKGLYTKQSKDGRGAVSFSSKDISMLFPNDDIIISELKRLEVEDDDGNKYGLHDSTQSIMKGSSADGKFEATEATLYQEAISSLILANKLPTNDIKSFLLESNINDHSGIFKYIRVNESPSFNGAWSNFLKTWMKTFELEFSKKDEFETVANGVLSGNVNQADIIHPAVISSYDNAAKILLAGADKFDKSDVYYCVGDTNKIVSDMLELRKKNDVYAYVDYMVQHSSDIIGVSLKKVEKKMRVRWDIPAKDSTFFDKHIKWIKTDAETQGIEFKGDDGELYLLAIRPNSKNRGDKGTIEWKEVGASAQMGKAVTAVNKHFGDKLFNEIRSLQSERKHALACKLLLKVITGEDAQPGDILEMTDKGRELITKIFNDGCGFNSTDDAGRRVSTPYIKVY